MGRRIADNAVELATRLYRAGEDDLAEADKLAELLLATLRRVRAREGSLIRITSSCGGRLDGRDVVSDGRIADLISLLEDHRNLAPPRSKTLTPLAGETPILLRSVGGGWIGAGHGGDNYAGEQPPKLEPRR